MARKRYYGQEPENQVAFEFDETQFNFVQQLMIRFFSSLFWIQFDTACVRYVGGSINTRFTSLAQNIPYQRTLMLRSIGSKTGQLRDCALPYVVYEGRYCVVGTRAGGPIHPAWVLNLRRNPACWAWIDRKRTPCRAEEAQGDLREKILDRIREEYGPFVDTYLSSALPRIIPVMMLTPCKQYE